MLELIVGWGVWAAVGSGQGGGCAGAGRSRGGPCWAGVLDPSRLRGRVLALGWPMVWVGLLGPLLVIDGEGREVAVPARKERAVLALVALRADRPVRLGELVAALWGDAPPASATKTAQSYVSLLRRRLGADTIEHGPGGYRLRLSADQVDVTRFEAALRAAAEAAAQGQPERVVGLAGEALGLWRGEPLPDLDDQPLGLAEATRLGELRRAGQDGLSRPDWPWESTLNWWARWRRR